MRIPSPALLFFVLLGALAGWIVGGIVPAPLRGPFLDTTDYRLARPVDKPLEVKESLWTFLPSPLLGDFDLQMDVSLAADTDLDVLVRQVEPRLADGQVLPFQGRFAALRLTTGTEGPGWRSRDDTILGARGGGVGLAPGYQATVWIQARGRRLTANVAGKDQGTFTADDRYGMTTFVVHGGNAVVHRLEIKNLGSPNTWLWSRWSWTAFGALGAFLVAALVALRGTADRAFDALGLLMPVLAWFVAQRAQLDLALPSPATLATVLCGCLVVPLARLHRFAFAPAWALAIACALAGGRQLRHETAAMDALFGPDAGSQISEAHAQAIRRAPGFVDGVLLGGGLHDVGRAGKCVMLLGGQLLYDRALSGRGEPNDHLERLLGRELRVALRQEVLVPCLPTADGHTAQQWRLFATCFTGYRPAVLVLGVSRDEMAIDAATGVARSSPDQVRATIAAAGAWCGQHACKLLVFADSGLPDNLRTVLRDVAAAGTPTVVAADGATPGDIARNLAAAIRPLLAP